MKGSNSSTLLKGVAAPPRRVDLFIGRLDVSTTEEAVVSHVDWLLKEVGKVNVEEIPHCAEAYGYKGFKLSVPAEAVTQVLKPEGWPTHVSVNKYYQPKGSMDVKNAPKPVSGVNVGGSAKTLTRSASVGSVVVRT